jgi:hypothetical protein
MRKHEPSHGSRPEQDIDQLKKLRYEESDISLPTILKWIVFLFAFVGVTSVVTWLIYLVFVPNVPYRDAQSTDVVNKLGPGQPALQPHPKIDMREFRAIEDVKTSTYGWYDKGAGQVRAPIDVTIEKILASGELPKAEPGGGAIKPNPSAENMPGGVSNPPGTAPDMPEGMPNGRTPGIEAQQPNTPHSAPRPAEPGTPNNPGGRVP